MEGVNMEGTKRRKDVENGERIERRSNYQDMKPDKSREGGQEETKGERKV
jgi:hypothetical protein